MKKLILLICLASLQCKAAEADFRKGIDFTGLTSATGAQHNQLVDNATVAAKRGLVIVQTATPDTTTYPRYTNYLWLDINFTPPILKSWSWGVTNWVTATIPVNSVSTAIIQDGAVTNPKLATNSVNVAQLYDNSVTSAKIVALAVTSEKIAVGGVDKTNIIDGTINNTKIATSGIVTTNIADGSVTTAKLANGAIVNTNLAINSVSNVNIIVNGVVNTNIAANAVARTNILDQAVNTNKLSFYIPEFVTSVTNAIPTAGTSVTLTHGLSGQPTAVRVVLKCVASDSNTGYSSGDEIEIFNVVETGGGIVLSTYSTTAATIVTRRSTGGIFLLKKTDGVLTTVSAEGNFRVVIRAKFQP